MRIAKSLLLTFLILSGCCAYSAGLGAVQKNITTTLHARFPDLQISGIRDVGVPGWYEVMLGSEVIYVTADGRYLFQGDLLDLDQHRNLTEERRRHTREALLKGIPTRDMIVFAPKKTLHSIYVFTDVDCPYCRRLHKDVPKLNAMGIAVNYLAFPRAGIGSDTYHEMEAVWCSKDRNTALTKAKLGVKIKAAKCDDPVKRQYQIGEDMGIRGTPAIYLENGRQIGGYLSPAEFAKIFKDS
jgi:thiol:disulfide interchange protein DsbC